MRDIAQPVPNKDPSRYNSELMKWVLKSKNTYNTLISDDRIEKRVMVVLRIYAEHEPNPNNLPIIPEDVKGFIVGLMNFDSFVESIDFHYNQQKSI